MKARSPTALLAVFALVALAATPGCCGPFAATHRLWHWNRGFEASWSRETMFVLTVPVYGLAVVGDMTLFNSADFWTGTSWIDEPAGDHHLEASAPIDAPPPDRSAPLPVAAR